METELSDIKPWLARLVRALAERFRDERERHAGAHEPAALPGGLTRG